MQPDRIVIAGAGAIGQLYGAKLSKHCCVSLFGRGGQAITDRFQLLNLDGSTLYWCGDRAANNAQPPSLVMLCCKSYQTGDAFAPLRQMLAPETPVLLMQNGMGSESLLGEVANPILKASITHGAMRLDSHTTQHTGLGTTELGLLSGQLSAPQQQTLTALLNQALPPVSWNSDILTTLWKKLIVNAAINPLTALYRVRNGELLGPDYLQQLNSLVAEAVEAAQAAGIHLEKEAMQQLVQQVAANTAGNRSSMLQDVEAGRQTELEFITGYLLNSAKQHKLALPSHAALYQQLKTCG